ncbi:small nuclear ribonucleoprotein G-like [Fukomys damarensis]|uniref:small nuclear ribonucleoprotein G-like n=1 Tax=Fukomys damarensis TaxID=885580 RepID=UPI001454F458|nr:small nuclear ribonucleoprotein G-like [Fukomys damarensis]
MSKIHSPELKIFVDKKLSWKLNGGRHTQGVLQGFHPFTVDQCSEMATSRHMTNIGMVIQRNSIMLESWGQV